jgi:hypothetical protein
MFNDLLKTVHLIHSVSWHGYIFSVESLQVILRIIRANHFIGSASVSIRRRERGMLHSAVGARAAAIKVYGLVWNGPEPLEGSSLLPIITAYQSSWLPRIMTLLAHAHVYM